MFTCQAQENTISESAIHDEPSCRHKKVLFVAVDQGSKQRVACTVSHRRWHWELLHIEFLCKGKLLLGECFSQGEICLAT